MFRDALKPPINVHVRCCEDNPAIGVNYIAPHVKKDLIFMRRWDNAANEKQWPNGAYCSNTQCGKWIHPKRIDRSKQPGGAYSPTAKGKATCGRCHTETCSLCNKAWHGGAKKQCDEDEMDKMFNELARKEMWQSCPNCGRVCQKTHGCNHITCNPGCGASFCYRCGRPYYALHYCDPSFTFKEEEIAAESGDPDAVEALRRARAGAAVTLYRNAGEMFEAIERGTFNSSRVPDHELPAGGRAEMDQLVREGRITPFPDAALGFNGMPNGGGRRPTQYSGQQLQGMPYTRRPRSVTGQFPPPGLRGQRPDPFTYLQEPVPGYPGYPGYSRQSRRGW